ncbi:hypothetical protein PMI38_01368 [Pseudomonas sp. GM84]|uniref:hypothetical protein n=1 Tax=Pseudomonas sp. GM84 TaxID=1144340 RepID=UPI00026FC6F1|nr:hypothetical protein [Pseudomonas sp. GM84]EJN39135.1 hypothetical protein PMI38_01368 [Pseudomonas sp. GM84]
MEDALGLVWSVLKTSVTSAAMVLAFAWLFRTWIGEKIKASLKYEYDERMEQLRSELKSQGDASLAVLRSEMERQADKLKIASASFSEVQKATISKKIEAVDAVWGGVIKSRASFPSDISITDILTNEELRGFYTDSRMYKYSSQVHSIDELAFFNVGLESVQLMRPHLGEYIWALYATYRSILGRSIYLVKRGRNEEDKLVWFEDFNIQRLVESAFGSEKLVEFQRLNGGRYQWLHNQFDTLLFKAIDTLLTGKSFGDAALRQAQEMEWQISAGRVIS